jgi:transcriptional regulator with XRE-family HTH domain
MTAKQHRQPSQRIRDVVAKNVRDWRCRREYTQARLAEVSGVYMNQISQIECAKGNPCMSVLDDIAKRLGCDISDLLREPEHADPPKPPAPHFIGQAYNHEDQPPPTEKEERIEENA